MLVGGTNPSLLEAMASKALIVSHDNKFNRSVLNKNAFYFSSAKQLSLILNKNNYNKQELIKNNLDTLDKLYRWPLIIEKYEKYFKKILKI